MINAPFTHCAGCCHYYNGVCNSLEKCPYQVAEMHTTLSREKEIKREIFARIEQQIYDHRYDAKEILREVKFYELAKEYGVEVE